MRTAFTVAIAALLAGAHGCSDDAGAGGDASAGSTGGGATNATASGPGGTTSATTTGTSTSSSTSSQGGAGGGTGGGGGQGCGPLPLDDEPPTMLSQTGLYEDIAQGTVASWARPFQPLYELWSDGATKQRWVYFPVCEIVDTSDMDTWQVPVGTRLWKEFTRDGVKVETRLIMRTSQGFEFAAYQWMGNDAVRVQGGVIDANGTGHDIPAESYCSSCHRSDWRVLGFSAIQLSHGGPGETMASLSAAGLLSDPLPAGVPVPGNATEQAALGYLHANCGNCHYQGSGVNTSMRLRLLQAQATVMATDTYTSTVNVPSMMNPACSSCDRVEPGSPSTSAVIQRMSVRDGNQMPPFATEIVDAAGVAAVSAWIQALPP